MPTITPLAAGLMAAGTAASAIGSGVSGYLSSKSEENIADKQFGRGGAQKKAYSGVGEDLGAALKNPPKVGASQNFSAFTPATAGKALQMPYNLQNQIR